MDIKLKVSEFLSNKKKSNNILDVVKLLESDDSKIQVSSVRGLEKIFTHLLCTQAMYLPAESPSIESPSGDVQYKIWLCQRYADCKTELLKLLPHSQTQVQDVCLSTLMKFISSEASSPLQPVKKGHMPFPSAFFRKLLLHIISSETDISLLAGKLLSYMVYDDIRYVTMKTILAFLEEQTTKLPNSTTNNVLAILEVLSIPDKAKSDSDDKKEVLLRKLSGGAKRNLDNIEEPSAKRMKSDEHNLCKCFGYQPDVQVAGKMLKLTVHRKLYTTCWLALLKKELESSHIRRILTQLPDKVMPHMHDPLVLADFLTQAYNSGGALSVLALSGLFRLIHKHNLQYPDFYVKLYSMLSPSLLHVKFRDRFFHLLDFSLQSTHIPSYLRAAFTKRLARLCLVAPVEMLPLLVQLALNQIRRVPALRVLLHVPDRQEMSNDPFDNDERDPAKTRALESSLWEFKTLQEHWYSPVASKLLQLDTELSVVEVDITKLLETTTTDLINKEKKVFKSVDLTYLPPTTVCDEAEIYSLWNWN